MKTLALTIALLSMAGCAAPARSPEPVPVDKVECARCRMLVSSEVGAGQIVSSRQETRFYDDLGCLTADWAHQTKSDSAFGATATAFVRLTSGWTDARGVWFAHPAAARTAMGSGLVAYATVDEARAADRDGQALAWNEVLR
ncbi:MAG TPA: nitrous oxide reductase accessory protein NosL [Vicinamibacterales bacterium]|nr:nitrous oxide reductase accessory protein NosL [Vicinamibacterales bacterium]